MAKKQYRIATLGLSRTWFSYFQMGVSQGAFLNGHLHKLISLEQKIEYLEQELNYFKPHLVFCHAIFSESLKDHNGEILEREALHETLAKQRHKWGFKVIYQEGDAKKHPRFPFVTTELIDLCLINSALYKSYEGILKVPCIHWPYFALNQEDITIPDNLYKHSIVFTGNTSPRGPSHLHYGRAEFLDKLGKKIGLKLFPDSVVGNTRFCSQEIAAGTSVVLGINQGFDVPGYLDTRPWQYIGAGGLFFIDPSPAMDLFFEPNVHYVPYIRHDIDDVVEKHRYYMSENREAGNKIRAEGFAYVQAHHTSKHRVQMVIDIIEGKQPRYPIYLKEISHEECKRLARSSK